MMLVMYHATFFTEWGWRTTAPWTWSLGGLVVYLVRRLWIGVPIFFVVSGYCIAASSTATRGQRHSLWTYFSRRLRRIYPPLWVACALCAGFISLATIMDPGSAHRGGPVSHMSQFTLGNWIGNLFAIESWRTHLTGGEKAYLMGNTWTLCYEEQFYAVVGLILLSSAGGFFPAAAVVTIVTLVARHGSRAADHSLQGFFFDGHWLMFAVGILVYYRLHHAPPHRHGMIAGSLVMLVLYGLGDRFLSASRFEDHLDAYIVVAALFGLLLIGLHEWDQNIATSRWTRPFAAYGKMSYAVYLTHYPVVVVMSGLLAQAGSRAEWFTALVVIPLSVAVTLPVGWVFHMAVERHFLNAPLEAKQPRAAGRPEEPGRIAAAVA